MKNHSLKLPTIWSLTCLNRNNGGDGKAMLLPTTLWRSAFWRTMLLRTRAAAVLLIICILAGTSLYGSEGSITIAVVMDGSNQEDRAPLQVYLSKAMGQPVIIAFRVPGCAGVYPGSCQVRSHCSRPAQQRPAVSHGLHHGCRLVDSFP